MSATERLRELLDERGVEHEGGERSSPVSNVVKEYIESIEAENAKLRELARIMHGELVSCEDNGYICGGHKFDKSVSELGIEVDA